jgi:hypothetical protein
LVFLAMNAHPQSSVRRPLQLVYVSSNENLKQRHP